MTESAVYVVEKMAHGFRRLGRTCGSGFYNYVDGDRDVLWTGLSAFRRRAVTIPPEDVRDRLLYIMALAAVRDSERTLASVHAPTPEGAPPDTSGGVVANVGRLVERIDPGAFVARCRVLSARYGPRFDPPQSETAGNGGDEA